LDNKRIIPRNARAGKARDGYVNAGPYQQGEAGAAVRGGQGSSALTESSNRGKGGEKVDGVEALLKVEEDLKRDRENKAALFDALLVQEILSSVIHYFGALLCDEEKQAIIDLIVDAIINCDLNYGEKAAIKWGDGFKWGQETLDADLALFVKSGMDIKVMAATRLAALKHDRLNPERVGSLRADNPEREKLEEWKA
jgi:hypothetical protein